MRAIDASSIVHAWENYPIGQFPTVWTWLDSEIKAMRLHIPFVAFEEVKNVEPNCAQWLTQANVNVLPIGNAVTVEANRLKGLLGIVGDRYGGGVGENDLLIIASARTNRFELISNEASQPSLPANLANYKIPAVCNLNQVNVTCYPYLSYMMRSGNVF